MRAVRNRGTRAIKGGIHWDRQGQDGEGVQLFGSRGEGRSNLWHLSNNNWGSEPRNRARVLSVLVDIRRHTDNATLMFLAPSLTGNMFSVLFENSCFRVSYSLKFTRSDVQLLDTYVLEDDKVTIKSVFMASKKIMNSPVHLYSSWQRSWVCYVGRFLTQQLTNTTVDISQV